MIGSRIWWGVWLTVLVMITATNGTQSATTGTNEGCFMYEESAYYCKDISESLAQEECAVQGCNYQDFFRGRRCVDLDMSESCSRVLCKSTCTLMPARSCRAGPVPAGEENQWCGRGCCRYGTGESRRCERAESRSHCEMGVSVAGEKMYEYLISNTSCTLECSRGLKGALRGEVNARKSNNSLADDARSADTADQKKRSGEIRQNSRAAEYIMLIVLVLFILAGAVGMVVWRAKRAADRGRKQKKAKPSQDGTHENGDELGEAETLPREISDSDGSDDNSYLTTNEDNNYLTTKKGSLDSRLNERGDMERSPRKEEDGENNPQRDRHHQAEFREHQARRLHAFEEFAGRRESHQAAFDKLDNIAKSKRTAFEKLEKYSHQHNKKIGDKDGLKDKIISEERQGISDSEKKKKGVLEKLRSIGRAKDAK